MPLNENPLDKSTGHIADHAVLKSDYDTRGSPQGTLPAFTTASTRLQHAKIHNILGADYNALGGTPAMPTNLDSIDDVGHLGYHSALAVAYNERNSDHTVLFEDGFAANNFFKWNSLQWSTSGVVRLSNGDDYSGTGEYSCQVVNESPGHPTAARFELRNGDIPYSGTERAEISEPIPAETVEVHEGDERWIEFDLKFDAAFPSVHASSNWCIVQQWHDLTLGESPPLCLNILDADDIIYISNDEEVVRTPVQTINRGVWEHWVIHAKFSTNPAVGFVEIHVDGVEKVPLEFRRTILVGDTGNYFKMGMYRDPVNTATQILYYDNFKILGP